LNALAVGAIVERSGTLALRSSSLLARTITLASSVGIEVKEKNIDYDGFECGSVSFSRAPKQNTPPSSRQFYLKTVRKSMHNAYEKWIVNCSTYSVRFVKNQLRQVKMLTDWINVFTEVGRETTSTIGKLEEKWTEK
jgi:hypothetical protein